MCGITGVISKRPLRDNYREIVCKMHEALLHRGPDEEGGFNSPHVALAHRRLSIIDLKTGRQPLFSDDRSIVLVANGEIYNYIELRKQLKEEGYRFNTNSDCEVIIYLYKKYGVQCLEHLRGMFAFALWDEKKKRLMLARDRMGEKPLYLYEENGMLLFTSEMKSLLKSGLVSFELDPVSVNEFFHYQYIPEPKTVIKGVRKLPAGNYLTVDVDRWNKTQRAYWRMEDAPPLEGDPAQLIRQELERISTLIIRSDVPVGIALSSGIDSSAIAALTAKRSSGMIHAFCVGYPGHPYFDERKEAKALADYLGLQYHDVEISTSEMIEFFPELISWQDDPIADISGYNYFALMKAARKNNVPVMLQGHGGDELFWGYPWAKSAVQESMLKSEHRFTSSLRALLNSKLELPREQSLRGLYRWGLSCAGLNEAWHRFTQRRSLPKERLIFYDLNPDYRMAMKDSRNVYTPAFQERIAESDPSNVFTLPIPWGRIDIEITRLICQTYLLENGIAQIDRLSMASSIESRLPLVDYKLVELVIGLRKTQTDYQLPPKTWLKSAVKDVLPDWIMNRPKKGFAPPVIEWNKQLFSKYGALLQEGFLLESGILTEKSAHDLSAGRFRRGDGAAPLCFKALVLEMWCRQAEAIVSQKN